MASEPRIGVDLIAGFRGSGKTTLIRALADGLRAEQRVLFLQNEAGRTDLAALGEDAVLWQGGCICCAAATLFGPVLTGLVQDRRSERIVVELAETARIADVTALFGQLGDRFRVEHILYVLNAAQFPRRWALSQRFIEGQLREASALFLNRTEEASPGVLADILAAVGECAPRCAVLREPAEPEALYAASRVFRRLGPPRL